MLCEVGPIVTKQYDSQSEMEVRYTALFELLCSFDYGATAYYILGPINFPGEQQHRPAPVPLGGTLTLIIFSSKLQFQVVSCV